MRWAVEEEFGNSFVAYLLEIINYNPIDYNLPFEVFAGIDYCKEPDIDLNFATEIRPKILKYLQEKFGKDKTILAGTIETLDKNTIENTLYDYCKTFEISLDKLSYSKDIFVEKLQGIKENTGEHSESIFIIPEDLDISDFTPTELVEGNLKTHCDYHLIWNKYILYKFDILGHSDPSMLHELEKLTNINSNTIDLDDKETLALFLHANDNFYNNSLKGVPEFSSEFARNLLDIIKPRNFNDLVCTFALLHGTDTWKYNAEDLIKKGIKINEVISNRADIFNFLLKNGIDKEIAFQITEFIRKGKASKERSLWQNIRDRYKDTNEQWEKYHKIMEKHNIPKWYIESAEKVGYLFPKSHAIGYTINSFKIAWYKVHYPKAFYKAYFKIYKNLNLKEYYNRAQIKRELNMLYDVKEIHEYNKDFVYNVGNNYKIENLEILLEMYERGILQDKEEIKDDYNLINSRVIADYCRSIKHQFNTEELAVLVFRNKRMSIEEKIEKYNDI